jgi:hypothetical protein
MEQQQQQQQGQMARSSEDQDSGSQPVRSDDDDTWGLGSASALDYLRRRNFRGRRSPNGEDRPKGE